MKAGISLYPGLPSTHAPYQETLEKAHAFGIQRIFTSLHIPEAHTAALRQDITQLLRTARKYHMDVIADISPNTAKLLDINPANPLQFVNAGITTVRLDFGFSAEKAALFSRMMRIQLNASTIQPSYLQALRSYNANFTSIDSLHNFYPRPYTGLSPEFVQSQTRLLHDAGISVGAFVPSQTGRRAPLYEGLPTIEDHRCCDVSLAGRHLTALGMDSVFIGDDAPTDAELQALSTLQKEERNTIVINALLYSKDWHVRDLLSHTFTARSDPAAYALRTTESRNLLNGYTIAPDDSSRERHPGDITLDNTAFLRYMGEVQIVLKDMPKETRTNIVARVIPSDMFLLSYIVPGKKFRFEFVRS